MEASFFALFVRFYLRATFFFGSVPVAVAVSQLSNAENPNHHGDRELQQTPPANQAFFDQELILEADLWSDEPQIISARPAFDGIMGIQPFTKDAVEAAGGSWIDDLSCFNEEEATGRAVTSAAPANLTFIYDCATTPDRLDGLPICFTWPILPSSISREHFLFKRSDDVDITPNCIGSWPNFEYNERHCVVLLDDFFNREPFFSPARATMISIEIVGHLLLVGPGGFLRSAQGLKRYATLGQSSYFVGPQLLAARLQLASDLGEGGSQWQQFAAGNSLPNSPIAMYGVPSDGTNERLYRLRMFHDQGVTPNGITGLKPSQFDEYYSIILSTGVNIDRIGVPVAIGGGSITVLGLADLGQRRILYDDCYNDDRDNYIDIVLSVVGANPSAIVSTVESVLAYHKGNVLYNPGGPGRYPVLGVTYTAPTPTSQMVSVNVDLDGTGVTTYCRNTTGYVSRDAATCSIWRASNSLQRILTTSGTVITTLDEQEESPSPTLSPIRLSPDPVIATDSSPSSCTVSDIESRISNLDDSETILDVIDEFGDVEPPDLCSDGLMQVSILRISTRCADASQFKLLVWSSDMLKVIFTKILDLDDVDDADDESTNNLERPMCGFQLQPDGGYTLSSDQNDCTGRQFTRVDMLGCYDGTTRL